MEAVLRRGLDCIRLIQTWSSPPLTVLMKIITGLGSAYVFVILIPFIFWCIDEKKGLRLGIITLVSVWLNIFLKILLNQPRPFFEGFDPAVGMIAERMGGFPSGHAQNSLVMWFVIASWGKKKRFFVCAAFFCLLVGFSRVYLGVHFPTDVFGGWMLGAILLCIYFFAGKRIENALASPRAAMIACAALSFVMILDRQSAELVMPAGLLLGLGTGCFLNKRYTGFSASCRGRTGAAKYLTLAVRFALGITVMAVLYAAAGKILPGFSKLGNFVSGNFRLLVFLLFALIALWVSAGAPWLFSFLRLSTKEDSTN